MRLRQVVLVAETLEPAVGTLRRLLDLGEGFRDPGVGEFGLVNTVLAVGDTFLEVVAPKQEDTAAERFLKRRRGEGGYMVIVQIDDMELACKRMDELGVRKIWQADHADIKGTHLHPRDVGGAILSLDQAIPPESWRWAGPRWQDESSSSVVSKIAAVELQAEEPEAMARRWGEVLDRKPTTADGALQIELDRGRLRFVEARDGRGPGVSGFDVVVTDRPRLLELADELGLTVEGDSIELVGVRLGLLAEV